MKFTKSQLEAIKHPLENLQLIACAGSGKTEVVAQRVAYLLTPGNKRTLLPRNIIAFTFTEKAAAELKQRILQRVREVHGEIHGLAEMYVGTIHGFCLDLLMTEVPEFLKYGVLNEVQQHLFVNRHSKQSGLTECTDLRGQKLKRFKDTKHYLMALSILRESDRVEDKLQDCSLIEGMAAYDALLRKHRYFDYSTILESAVKVLTNEKQLRDRIAERLRYVIVDEYQDVNPIQETIVCLLHNLGAKICVVGDDDQTIYQWRGSDITNILEFTKRYPRAKTILLEENFRSSNGIVATARSFIEKNTVRLPKAMKRTDAQCYEVGDVVALPFDTPEAEATYIANKIKALRGIVIKEDGPARGISWADMAILMRSVRANGGPITTALKNAKVPYVVAGMNNLFDTDEAKAAREFFYFIADRPGVDKKSVETAWISANLGIAKDDLRRAITRAERTKATMDTDEEERWSVYNIQRQYLAFLEQAGIREEKIPETERRDVVFFNLGKFSQLISDFETIHFHSKPIEKYRSFADFLQYQAEDAYPEGWQDNQYANPDAVRIMTVHQAKGMQWPVVFLPALLRNRFPSRKPGGRTVWHLLPRDGVKDQPRFEGTREDERRLFYVAMTRSQKFLHMTWAPVPGNQQAQKASEFWNDVLVSKFVKRRKPDYSKRKRLPPSQKRGIADVTFTFSDLKYFFECPYQFKLRILYGFNAPIDEALGYGKSLHDALAEVHSRAIRGDIAWEEEAGELVDRHIHTPFAYPTLRGKLRSAAETVVANYLQDNLRDFANIEFSEKQIEINLGDGVSVAGRIDLVRRLDTNETTIVDLKSSERAQAEEVTEVQLHTYALGYQELMGRPADYVEIYELDERRRKPRSVDTEFIEDVKEGVRTAAEALRRNEMPPKPTPKRCPDCDYLRMCTKGYEVTRVKTGSTRG